MPEALLALGGNVGDARATLEIAIATIAAERDVNVLAVSHFYRTPPWGMEDQPAFVNAAVKVATDLLPPDLLARMQAIERAHGRDRAREARWGPRSLDIDLIAYGDRTWDSPDLTLPHPRALERAFVLAPLSDIAPHWRIGGTGVAEALARSDTAGIVRLP